MFYKKAFVFKLLIRKKFSEIDFFVTSVEVFSVIFPLYLLLLFS